MMWGAIIGDLAGSIYEFDQLTKIKSILVKDLITDSSFYSDDTICTISILDAMLTDKDFSSKLKEYGNQFLQYKPNFSPYFKTSFSPGFIKWIKGDFEGTSCGNGAMMRISPIGYLCSTEEEVMYYAKQATIPSHNCKEAIDSATLIARIIFLARKGYSKKEIIEKLNIHYSFLPYTKFNSTCHETIDNCLYSLFESSSFEMALKSIISYGGDTDTNACIVGSMTEALYGIDSNLIIAAKKKLPETFVKKLEFGYSKSI